MNTKIAQECFMSESTGKPGDKSRNPSPRESKGPPPLPTTSTRAKQPKPTRSRPKVAEASEPRRATLWWATGGGAIAAVALIVFFSFSGRGNTQKKSDGQPIAQTNPASTTPGSNSSPDEFTGSDEVTAAEDDAQSSMEKDDLLGSLQEKKVAAKDQSNVPDSTTIQSNDLGRPGANSKPELVPHPKAQDDPVVPPVANEQGGGKDVDPDDKSVATLDALIDSAAALVKAMKGKEAIATLRKASNLYPKDIRPDFYLGLLHSGVGVGDPKMAETHFKKVLDRSPNHLAVLNNLALVEVRARKFGPARNFLAIAVKDNPGIIELNQNLGRLISQAKVLEIKNDELKRISGVKYQQDVFSPRKGWMYMPLDDSDRSVGEYKSFCRSGNLEDVSCNICAGRTVLPCKSCGGNGTEFQPATVSELNSTTLGIRSITTTTAAASRCSVCGGDGCIDCHGCTDGTDPSLGAGDPRSKQRQR